MNSASARLKTFPETFDEKIRRRLGPELGPLDFAEELSVDVAADVSLGGVALIGHKGFPSISISDCATAWRNVVRPSRRTGFITRDLFCYQFSYWHGKLFFNFFTPFSEGVIPSFFFLLFLLWQDFLKVFLGSFCKSPTCIIGLCVIR